MSEIQKQEDASTAPPAVFEFEGDEISDFSAQIPSTKLEAPVAYPRGTILDLRLQVRVRSVRLDEGRGGALTRNHILAIEECNIVGVMTPAQRAALLAELQAAEAAEAEADEAPVIEEDIDSEVIDEDVEAAEGLVVDPDDPEDWANLSEEEKNELRRRAVEDGVDEFEAHQPHPANEPVQAAAGEVEVDGLEVGASDLEPGRPRELAGVDPGF